MRSSPSIAPFVRVDPDEPREQLLVRESADGMDIVVVLPVASAEAVLSRDASAELDAYLGAVEGISHFIHLAERARTELPTTLLELELQAEVDKWLVATLLSWDQRGAPIEDLRHRLYGNVRYLPDLDAEERARYLLANEAANEYTARLEARYVRRGAVAEMLGELRRFYQQGLAGKLDRIARAA